MEAALAAEVSHGVPFVSALMEQSPELAESLERALSRGEAPEIHWVRPLSELVARLPPGLCERLLAVPVYEDVRDGRVDVAAVDVLGPHVGAEFAFHLRAPVRVLRARLSEVRAALAGLAAARAAQAREPSQSPQAARRPSSLPARALSDAPIPLVRRSIVSRHPPSEGPEPVLSLARSKVFSPEPPFSFELSFEAASADIARAQSAEEVAASLCQALEPALALVVAVRAGTLSVRAASRSLRDPTLLALSLATGKNSVFDIAVRAGFYLGPLPATPVHAELRAFLPGTAADEVYAAPVLVAARPVLALLMARFGPSLDATRRADRLLVSAASSIERIVMSKKRGPGSA